MTSHDIVVQPQMTYRASYHRRTNTISNETLLNKKETYKWKFIALYISSPFNMQDHAYG